MARAIKSEEELKCVKSSIRATEQAVGAMRDVLQPGMTEQQLWSILRHGVLEVAAAIGPCVELLRDPCSLPGGRLGQPAGLAPLVAIAWILLVIVVTRMVINQRDA